MPAIRIDAPTRKIVVFTSRFDASPLDFDAETQTFDAPVIKIDAVTIQNDVSTFQINAAPLSFVVGGQFYRFD